MISTGLLKPTVACVCFALALTVARGAMGAGEVDHSPYDALLKKHSRNGLVDYGAMKKDLPGLDAYLKTLSDSSAVHYATWSRDTRLAFWINAYNALAIYAVATDYPIRAGEPASKQKFPEGSIGRIEDVWNTAYFDLAGKPVSLDEIHNGILRKQFGDPRIHFALVRASRGSPLLSDEAYRAEVLDEQLERDAVRFVNDYDKVRVNITRGRLHVSEIFDWYAADFVLEGDEIPEWLTAYRKKTRGFVSFIAERVDRQTREAIEKRGLKVDYLKYDWSLNDLPADE